MVPPGVVPANELTPYDGSLRIVAGDFRRAICASFRQLLGNAA